MGIAGRKTRAGVKYWITPRSTAFAMEQVGAGWTITAYLSPPKTKGCSFLEPNELRIPAYWL